MAAALAYFNLSSLSSDGGVPSEFRLLAKGGNPYMKEGMEQPGCFIFDDESADDVMARYKASGRDALVIDYEHATFDGAKDTAPAAGWFVPSIKDGELWATNVKWTKRAEEYLRNKEYRFYSPTLEIDEAGHVTALRPVALTNDPALCNLKPLVAANRNAKGNPMKLILKALDLEESAEESVALHAVTTLKDLRAQVLTLTGKATVGEALGVLHAQKEAAAQVVKLSAEVAKLNQERQATEIESLISEAVKDGRLAPAKRDEIMALTAKVGMEGLKAFLSMLPKQAAQGAPAIQPTNGQAVVSLSAAEIQVATAMNVTPEAFAAHKARLGK